MASLINRFFSNVFSYFPWHFNGIKRPRDDPNEENEENFDTGVTPSKKQKLNLGPFRSLLKEVNTQPAVPTVRSGVYTGSKLHIGQDHFQPKSFKSSKNSMPLNWGETIILDDDERPRKLPSSKSRNKLSAEPVSSIDLTKDDDERREVSDRVPFIDLTRDSRRMPQLARRSLPRATPDSCYLSEGNNSRTSEECLTDDEEISDDVYYDEEINRDTESNSDSDCLIVKNSNLPGFVDLTEQESHYSTPEKKSAHGSSTVSDNENRKKRSSLPNKTPFIHSRQYPFSRVRCQSTNSSLQGSKSVVTLDFTHPNDSTRRKRHTTSSMSHNVSVIDLKEWNDYGRVLGSMLDGKLPVSPPQPPPPAIAGTVDLTLDEDVVIEDVAQSREKQTRNVQTPVIEKSGESSSAISSSTRNGIKKEVMRVNSFQEKITGVQYTQQEWVQKLIKEYKDTQNEFNSTRDKLMKETLKWSQINHKDVEAILEEKINRHLRITEALLPEEPEEPYPSIVVPLPQFTKEMEARVRAAFVRHPEKEVLITKFGLQITRGDIHTLSHLNWLNDEVINFYMQLLEERSRQLDNYPKVHTFSTFFYTGLQKRGHDGMKRWTKKVNIFEKDIVIVPIHLHVHWCLTVIDIRKKEINYYDSMGNDNNECLQHMSKYLKAEHKAKVGSELDLTDWKIQNVRDIPQQLNGSDCGVFACTYAEYSARRAPFTFDQSKMQYFRRKMTYEIITGQLL